MPIILLSLGVIFLDFKWVCRPRKRFGLLLCDDMLSFLFFPSPRYLLEQDFPGMRIGPEPTTDSFIAVMYGETEGSTPGNALVVDPKKPFRKLSRFGNAFLNR